MRLKLGVFIKWKAHKVQGEEVHTAHIEKNVVALRDEIRPAASIVVAVTVLACMLVITFTGWFTWSFRESQIRDADIATTNVARMVAVQVESAMKTASVVLTDVVERVEADGISDEAMTRLSAHLVQTTKSAAELHGAFVYDETGGWLATSLAHPVKGDNSDRNYFKFHRTRKSAEVHISGPIRSRSTGVWIIPVSKRINRPDGSFGGVALVTLKINFFERIYQDLNIGKTGTVLLALADGTVIYRKPFDERVIGSNLSKGAVFGQISRNPIGSAILFSKVDGIERLYAFRRIQAFPFVVAVGQTKSEFLAPWVQATWLICSVGLLVCTVFVMFARKLYKQIALRDIMQSELRTLSEKLLQHNSGLQRLAHTDNLTDIANRRRFDEVLSSEVKRASRTNEPLSLALIDVDFFKQYNDTYGHQAGDACLQAVAKTLGENAERAGDTAARYGGEEFAVILPNTDQAGAFAVADKIRVAICLLGIPHEQSPYTFVSASIGVGTIMATPELDMGPEELISLADTNLYRAKKGGRNRVWSGE